MDEDTKETRFKDLKVLNDLENRVRALEYLQRHNTTKEEMKQHVKEVALFLYNNAELFGLLAVFLIVNVYVWRRLV